MLNYLYILLGLAVTPAHANIVVAYEADNGATRIEMTDEPCPENIAKKAVPKKIKAVPGPLFIYKVIQKLESGVADVRYECFGLLYAEKENGSHVAIPIISWDENWMVAFSKEE